MGNMLPTLQIEHYRAAIDDYLSTTFALTESEVSAELSKFLNDPHTGMFRGPYLRIRMPFAAADRPATEVLEWYGAPYSPHGHQLAAFERLTSSHSGIGGGRPLPTLVTTGTGSGKTEAFLFPILDHVRRARAAGIRGTKALLLYPMNALANDQARRLAKLISNDPELAGIRAAIYVGEQGQKQGKVSGTALINDREAIRAEAPDILLTNYKMLDQLLLRPYDQGIWQQSATSLRYLVLDEFHTYDGAQGTDVAMLLRRLGFALKRNWPTEPDARAAAGIDEHAETHPLGLITPVATSATLGGEDHSNMVSFANTVFGGGFDSNCLVGETRLTVTEWTAGGEAPAAAGAPLRLSGELVGAINIDTLIELATREQPGDGLELARSVIAAAYEHGEVFRNADAATLHDALRAHPDIATLVTATTKPVLIDELADRLIDRLPRLSRQQTTTIISVVVAALSQVRDAVGFSAPSIDVNHWTRAITRIDRYAGPTAGFRWSDDGGEEQFGNTDAFSNSGREAFPALFCRHCGRTGWGVTISTAGEQRDVEAAKDNPRASRATGSSQFRALIDASLEADFINEDEPAEGFGWWGVLEGRIHATHPAGTNETADTNVLPVRWLEGPDAASESKNDTCPSCGQRDGIRFIGSSVATLLSVVTTSMFGDSQLADEDKKALIFTDSVQDAAHRAAFVQARSHSFGIRNAIRRALGSEPTSLDQLAAKLLEHATTRTERYRLLAPDLVDRPGFKGYWDTEGEQQPDFRLKRKVLTRIEFDLALEFGLQSGFARTLERTSSVTVEVDTDSATKLEGAARAAIDGYSFAAVIGRDSHIDADTLIAWARGALEHLRIRGGINHTWLDKYVHLNGLRWAIWGGRTKGAGMPAFPPGRSAPAFARIGTDKVAGKFESGLESLRSPRGWYARWTARLLDVHPTEGAELVQRLFNELANAGLVRRHTIDNVGSAFGIEPSRIIIAPATDAQRSDGHTMLRCDRCDALTPASPTTVKQLSGRRCGVDRCDGHLHPHPVAVDNYYRRLYEDSDMRRVVAREHTSLLPDSERLQFETEFKSSADNPDAPNVLVATPTLEMGIDIGDLSTVMLASLPRTVANYVQRVGRAGRRTGSALSMAFVPGRFDQLAWYHEPLALIDGRVEPPATYLDAIELAKRQLVASIIDRLASTDQLGFTQSVAAEQLLRSVEPETPLGRVIEVIEQEGTRLVTKFVAAFARHLREATIEELNRWVTADANGVIPAAAEIAAASTEYATAIDELNRRIAELTNNIGEIEIRAAAPNPEDNVQDELRAAESTRRMLRGMRHTLQSEFWVSALERCGILPNYTLLDDSVTLDVGVSWVDADTGSYEYENYSYSRDAGNAIREFAPGSKFYARGMVIEIDGVETGPKGENVHECIVCPECGYVRDLFLEPLVGAAGSCPRCGNGTFADTGQRLNVLEFDAVSAEVRRDEAQISDRSDEREQSRFQLVNLADIDPKQPVRRWFDHESGLGVTYARSITLRTFNLGLGAEIAGGTTRLIGGQSLTVPLFRVCRDCGHVDRKPDSNSWREHRPWCPHRKNRDEDPIEIALGRTLRTQGIIIRLPSHLATGDEFALPSLSAALLLGLRRVIGGDPNHIALVAVRDIDAQGNTHEALLIHDRVPGGTGYLADCAEAAGLERILLAAYDVVANCECQHTHHSACHRCLLTHTTPQGAPYVWRKSGEQALLRMLGYDPQNLETENDINAHNWNIQDEDPGTVEFGSVIEREFIDCILEQGAPSLAAKVSQQPGTYGNTLTLTLPQGQVRVIVPQERIGNTQPDFVIESKDASHGKLAVYTDGHAYHATAAINRVADDATKRAGLRSSGNIRVVSVTKHDLDEYQRGVTRELPDWIANNPNSAKIANRLGLGAAELERLAINPVQLIVDWMRDPVATMRIWDKAAEALPYMVINPNHAIALDERLAALFPSSENAHSFGRSVGNLSVSVRIERTPGSAQSTCHTAAVLDDSPEALDGTLGLLAWQEWLAWSNIAGVNENTLITTTSLLDSTVAEQPTVKPDSAGRVDVVWADAFALVVGETEHRHLNELFESKQVPEPMIGDEIGEGIPVFAHWPNERLVWAPDLDSDSAESIARAGIQVVVGDVNEIIAVFRQRQEQ